MDKSHPIYESMAFGILVVVFFLLTLFPFNTDLLWKIVSSLTHKLTEGSAASEMLARLVVLGAALNFIGWFVSILSTVGYQDYHWTDDGRRILKDRVVKSLEKYQGIPKELKARIAEAPPDALFAWMHYSDERQALIDWGRTRSRYRYVAENWMISVVLGIVTGLTTLLLVWLKNAFGLGVLRGLALCVIPLAIWFVFSRFRALDRFNKRSENGMVAAYAASRIDPQFGKDWLPPGFSKNT